MMGPSSICALTVVREKIFMLFDFFFHILKPVFHLWLKFNHNQEWGSILVWTPTHSWGLDAKDVQSTENWNLGTGAGRLENQPDVSGCVVLTLLCASFFSSSFFFF